MGGSKRSSLQGKRGWGGALPGCGDPRRRLTRQAEIKLPGQNLLAGIEFGIAAQDRHAAIRGREANVEHLDDGKFVAHGLRRQAVSQWLEPCTQGDAQTVSQEGDEDMGFDALFQSMINRTQSKISKIVLEGLEGGLDLGQLDIELPQPRGVLPA